MSALNSILGTAEDRAEEPGRRGAETSPIKTDEDSSVGSRQEVLWLRAFSLQLLSTNDSFGVRGLHKLAHHAFEVGTLSHFVPVYAASQSNQR